MEKLEDLYFREAPAELIKTGTPELALWLNVLVRALLDAAGQSECNHLRVYDRAHEKRLARQWLTALDTAPGGFIWVCEILSDYPDALRDMVLKSAYAGESLGYRKSGRGIKGMQNRRQLRRLCEPGDSF